MNSVFTGQVRVGNPEGFSKAGCIPSQVTPRLSNIFVMGDEWPIYETTLSDNLGTNIANVFKPHGGPIYIWQTVPGFGGPFLQTQVEAAGVAYEEGLDLPANLNEYCGIMVIDGGGPQTAAAIQPLQNYLLNGGNIAMFFGYGGSITLNPILEMAGLYAPGGLDGIGTTISVSSQDQYLVGVPSLIWNLGNIIQRLSDASKTLLDYGGQDIVFSCP